MTGVLKQAVRRTARTRYAAPALGVLLAGLLAGGAVQSGVLNAAPLDAPGGTQRDLGLVLQEHKPPKADAAEKSARATAREARDAQPQQFGGGHAATGSDRKSGADRRPPHEAGPRDAAQPSGSVAVREIRAGSAAAVAGLQPGDVITAVNGAPVGDSRSYTRAVREDRDGSVTLTVTRGVQSLTLTLQKPAGKPDSTR